MFYRVKNPNTDVIEVHTLANAHDLSQNCRWEILGPVDNAVKPPYITPQAAIDASAGMQLTPPNDE
jgi:hypothetical protein